MMGFRVRFAVSVIILAQVLLLPVAACAVEPNEMLADPKLEARARHLSLELRCLVCQNQSIDDSNAELARDLRILVRERLLAGDSDDQVKAFIVDRYGKFVLLKPPLEGDTLLLWLAPFLVLGGAGLVVMRSFAKSRILKAPPESTPLTADEEGKLADLLPEQRPKAQRTLQSFNGPERQP